MSLFFLFAWVLTGAFTLLFGAAAVLYIRRTLQLMRAESEDSPQERILDGIEHMNQRLLIVQDRLERMERRMIEGGDAEAGWEATLPRGASNADAASDGEESA